MIDISKIPLYQTVLYGIADAFLMSWVALKEGRYFSEKIKDRREERIASKLLEELASDSITFNRAMALREVLESFEDKKYLKQADSYISNPEKFPERLIVIL